MDGGEIVYSAIFSLTSYELCTYHARARLVEVERLEKFVDKLIVKQ